MAGLQDAVKLDFEAAGADSGSEAVFVPRLASYSLQPLTDFGGSDEVAAISHIDAFQDIDS